MSDIPKPWEQGWCPSKLPKSQKPKIKHAPDAKSRQGGIGRFHGKAASQHPAEQRREFAIRAAQTRKKNRELLSAEDLMHKKNFDPMEFLFDAAKGEALYEDHPFLHILRQYINDIRDRLVNDEGYGVLSLLEQLTVEGVTSLQDSYTPKELRVSIAKELMQYIRPKLKQMEHSGKSEESVGVATPLTEEEIKLFKTWFDSEF